MPIEFSPSDIADLEREVRANVNAAIDRVKQSTGQSGAAPMRAREVFDAKMKAAGKAAQVGQRLPEMKRLKGLARLAAIPVAKALLRAAQLVTREQREFNQQTLELLQHLQTQIDDLRASQNRVTESTKREFLAQLSDLRAEVAREHAK